MNFFDSRVSFAAMRPILARLFATAWALVSPLQC